MQEQINCSKCLKDKLRIRDKAYYGQGKKRSYAYVNPEGRLWYGRICPDCFYKTDERRGRRVKVTTRSCNLCKAPLPEGRYFNHVKCVENISYYDHFEHYRAYDPKKKV